MNRKDEKVEGPNRRCVVTHIKNERKGQMRVSDGQLTRLGKRRKKRLQ